jgi:hypothetical protein
MYSANTRSCQIGIPKERVTQEKEDSMLDWLYTTVLPRFEDSA